MANHNSALKRHRQNEKRRLRNRAVKSAVRTAVKRAEAAIKTGNAEEAKNLLNSTVSLLDSSVTKGVLHRNNASRKVSRLVSAVNAVASK